MKRYNHWGLCFVILIAICFFAEHATVPKVMADDGGPRATIEYFRLTTDGSAIIEQGLVKLVDNTGSTTVDTGGTDPFGYIDFRLTFDQDIQAGDVIETADITIAAVKSSSDGSAIADHNVVVDSTRQDRHFFIVKLKVPNALFSNIPITIDVALTENVVRTPNGVGNVPRQFSIKVVSEFASEAGTTVIDIGQAADVEPKKFLIVARTGATPGREPTSPLPPTTAMPDAEIVNVDNIPNLESFLLQGGTIDVFVNSTSDPLPNIVINEVMWAVDEADLPGDDDYIVQQWIELYNGSTETVNAQDITLRFVSGSKLPNTGELDGKKWTDRLSNVAPFRAGSGVTIGWKLGSKGKNGNSESDPVKPFISMYRKVDKLGDADGINGGNWVASTRTSHPNHRGTPGTANARKTFDPIIVTIPDPFAPPKDKVIINEVYNAEDNSNDWIEFLALADTDLENWTLSYTIRAYSENEILRLPKHTIRAGEILLLVNKPPDETDLAAGQDITAEIQVRGAGPHKYLITDFEIPNVNEGNFYLILREAKGWERYLSSDRIHDVAGTLRESAKTLDADLRFEPHTGNPGNVWETDIWPLNGNNTNAPNDHYLQTNRTFSVGKVWQRDRSKHGWEKDGGFHVGFKGGAGYDRLVAGDGTPGYHYDTGGTLQDLQVFISELMLTQGRRQRFPQWIEIRNISKTETVDLHRDTDGDGDRQGFSIVVENHHSGPWADENSRAKLHVEVPFKDLGIQYIPPNQTILIVSFEVTQRSKKFPAHRVASIWTHARNAFGMDTRTAPVLNAEGGFLLKLVDGNGTIIDEIGNLDGEPVNRKQGIGLDDPFSWNWPIDLAADEARTSLIRIMNDNRTPRWGVPNRRRANSLRGAVLPIGKRGNPDEYAWVHAVDTNPSLLTWYGDRSDISTPGYIDGTPLPVALSAFRPVLQNGKIVIRWTTESEIDNAGFNIYRSEQRTGEFSQVNTELIQGHGTTSERHTYEWVDPTAKIGVVYYYQIEDVSFAGERQLLTTTKLKGLISAKNKLTTTWSELKNLQ